MLIAGAGLVATVDQLLGRPWPVSPDIHPANALNGSSLILPFTIHNPSLFSISNAEMTCGIDVVYFSDAVGNGFTLPQKAFVAGTVSIGAGQTINYTCDPSDFVKITPNGALSISGIEMGLHFSPGFPGLRAPFSIYKLCTWVAGTYQLFGIFNRRFTSVMFQWPARPGVNQWTEGPVYSEREPIAYNPGDYGSPLKEIDCSREPPENYVRFRGKTLEFVKNGEATPIYGRPETKPLIPILRQATDDAHQQSKLTLSAPCPEPRIRCDTKNPTK